MQCKKYIVSLAVSRGLTKPSSRKAFVDNAVMIGKTIQETYGFIGDTFKIRPDMLTEKLNNAIINGRYLKIFKRNS